MGRTPESNAEPTPFWWRAFPAGKKIDVVVRCSFEPEEPGQTRTANRKRGLDRGLKTTTTLIEYIIDLPELFPSITGKEDFQVMAPLAMLGIELTPAECDALINCPLVKEIVPNEKLDIVPLSD